MKYKPGDKVRIVRQWNKKSIQNSEGKMDHWLGKIMTINSCMGRIYTMMEDYGEQLDEAGWIWNESMIDGYASLEDVREGADIEADMLL